MRISLEKLEKNYTRVYYTSKRSKIFVAHKLIALKLRVLIDRNCFLS